jgi:hypothetical protein
MKVHWPAIIIGFSLFAAFAWLAEYFRPSTFGWVMFFACLAAGAVGWWGVLRTLLAGRDDEYGHGAMLKAHADGPFPSQPPAAVTGHMPMIVVMAWDMSSGVIPADMVPEIDRQIAEQKSRRGGDFASMAQVICFPDGAVGVVLVGLPSKKLLSKGTIGELATAPTEPYGSVAYLRAVEPEARRMAEATFQ